MPGASIRIVVIISEVFGEDTIFSFHIPRVETCMNV
jgi:hypothetical protein